MPNQKLSLVRKTLQLSAASARDSLTQVGRSTTQQDVLQDLAGCNVNYNVGQDSPSYAAANRYPFIGSQFYWPQLGSQGLFAASGIKPGHAPIAYDAPLDHTLVSGNAYPPAGPRLPFSGQPLVRFGPSHLEASPGGSPSWHAQNVPDSLSAAYSAASQGIGASQPLGDSQLNEALSLLLQPQHNSQGVTQPPSAGSGKSCSPASTASHSVKGHGKQQQPSGTGQRRRGRGTGLSVALNKSIMSASNVHGLLSIVRQKGHNFDFFNISSAVSKTPKLIEAESQSSQSLSGQSSKALLGNSSGAARKSDEASYDTSGMFAPSGGHGHTNEASVSGDAQELVCRLCSLTMQHIRAFDARGLANTAWAFAKLRYVPDVALPAMLASEASAKINDFAAQNLSNLAWAMVYMHHRDQGLLELMAARVVLLLDQFKPQELANIMWAFASLEHHDVSTSAALCSRAAELASAFNEQELSNVIWALGRMHHYDPELLNILLDVASRKLIHFSPQGVSNIVWALGQLGHKDEALFKTISHRCTRSPEALRLFDSQSLSNFSWGVAALNYRDSALVGALVCEALRRVGSNAINPHVLTSVLWAATVLGSEDQAMRLVDAVSYEAAIRPPSSSSSGWEAVSITNACWCCAELGHHDRSLFHLLAEALVHKLDRLNAQNVTHCVAAFAKVDGGSGLYSNVLQHLARRVERVAPTLSDAQCLKCADAFAAAKVPVPSAIEALLAQVVSLGAARSPASSAVAAALPNSLTPQPFNVYESSSYDSTSNSSKGSNAYMGNTGDSCNLGMALSDLDLVSQLDLLSCSSQSDKIPSTVAQGETGKMSCQPAGCSTLGMGSWAPVSYGPLPPSVFFDGQSVSEQLLRIQELEIQELFQKIAIQELQINQHLGRDSRCQNDVWSAGGLGNGALGDASANRARHALNQQSHLLALAGQQRTQQGASGCTASMGAETDVVNHGWLPRDLIDDQQVSLYI